MTPLHEHSGMAPMPGMVYLYALCHPVTREVRYVGQSVDPATRYAAHLSADEVWAVRGALQEQETETL